MSLRKLNLPQDLKELGTMISDSFQYPENPNWGVQEDERESLVEDVNNLARSWWMIRIGQVFMPAMRDLLPGMVWEEGGRIAGVIIIQRRGSSNNWIIGTVATRPEYRRKGIARRLVQAGLDFARKKKGKIVILGVIDANRPAYRLYESLGFDHFSGDIDLELTPKERYPAPELHPDYQLESSNIFDWKPRYHLMKRISPETIQNYEPVEEGLFRQPGFMRLLVPLISRAQKAREKVVLVKHLPSQQVVGYLRYTIRIGGKGRHTLGMRLDSDHSIIASQLIEIMLHETTAGDPTLMIEANLPTWQQHTIDAATALGFEKRVVYHRMGLKL
jgi:GNAT superfamily N-acetyltransferase